MRLPETGQEENCICFNYFENGTLVNTKYRSARKHFMMVKGAELIPYNVDSILDTPECIITEGEFDAAAVEDEREVARHTDRPRQAPHAVGRGGVAREDERPGGVRGEGRGEAAVDLVRVRRGRRLEVAVGEVHELLPVVRAELVRALVAVVAHALLQAVGAVEAVRGVPGGLLRRRARPGVLAAAGHVDEARRDEAHEVVRVVRQLGVAVDPGGEVRAEPVREVVQDLADRLRLRVPRPAEPRAAAARPVRDGHREALVLRARPERGLAAPAVPEDGDARRVQLGPRLDPVHDARVPPRPCADRAPAVGRAHDVRRRPVARRHVGDDADRPAEKRLRPPARVRADVVEVPPHVGVAARRDRVRRDVGVLLLLVGGRPVAAAVVAEEEDGRGMRRVRARREAAGDGDADARVRERDGRGADDLVGEPPDRRPAELVLLEPAQRLGPSAQLPGLDLRRDAVPVLLRGVRAGQARTLQVGDGKSARPPYATPIPAHNAIATTKYRVIGNIPFHQITKDMRSIA